MPKGNIFDNDLVALIFNATAIANIAINASSGPLTNLYVSLHTADPTAAGDQTSNEATYTGYARVAVARTSGGWTVASGAAANAASVTFGACSGGSNVITHVAIGTVASSGTGKLLWLGALAAPLSVSSGVTPQFAAGNLTTSET